MTEAALDPADTDGLADVYVWEAGGPGLGSAASAGPAARPELSLDGSVLAYVGSVPDAAPGRRDVLVTTTTVAGEPVTASAASAASDGTALSATGSRVAFADGTGGVAAVAVPFAGSGTVVLGAGTPGGTGGEVMLGVTALGASAATLAVDADGNGSFELVAGGPSAGFALLLAPAAERRVLLQAVLPDGAIVQGTALARTGTCPPESFRAAFTDIPPFRYDAYPAACLRARGIVGGAAPDAFAPDRVVSRRELAIMLARAAAFLRLGPLPPGAGFGDVAPGSVGAADIAAVAALGLTSGCGPERFCPEAPVTREQVAVFLLRVRDLVAARPGDCPAVPFTDLDASFARDAVSVLHCVGLTGGTSATAFSPGEPVTRGQFATFLLALLAAVAGP